MEQARQNTYTKRINHTMFNATHTNGHYPRTRGHMIQVTRNELHVTETRAIHNPQNNPEPAKP